MVMYATPEQLAGYLQKDVDTYTATQALETASAEFSSAADTWFTPQTVTYTTAGTRARTVWLPFHPISEVTEVRIDDAVIEDWTLVGQRLYRYSGFGAYSLLVPDVLEVDLVHGYDTVPDDVRLAVLEIAAAVFENPSGVVSETIDDYRVAYAAVPIQPGRPWMQVAEKYRGSWIF